jgi:hypothetical protein
MKLKILFPISHQNTTNIIEFYNRLIIKNITKFHKLLLTSIQKSKEIMDESEKNGELLTDISVSLILHKTDSNFDYSPNKNTLTINSNALKKQRAQIKKI